MNQKIKWRREKALDRRSADVTKYTKALTETKKKIGKGKSEEENDGIKAVCVMLDSKLKTAESDCFYLRQKLGGR